MGDGVVEILAKEIGAEFSPEMERPAVLFAYLRQLVGHIEHEMHVHGFVAPNSEQPAQRFLERVYQMCDGDLDREEAIQEAEIITDLISEVDSDDGWPVDKHLSLLHSICCAVRFGLETPCRSRWPAEAGGSVFKAIYGFRLHDRNTSRWEDEWLRDRFNDGLRALANAEKSPSPINSSASQGLPA